MPTCPSPKPRAVALAAAALSIGSLGQGRAVPTYRDDVRPIFKEACFKCHNPDKKKADIDLTTYAGVIAGGSAGEIVRRGSPDGSILYQSMAHSGEAETMPPKRDPLPEPQLALVREWIAGGLPESSGAAEARPAGADLAVDADAANTRPEGPPPMPPELSPDAAPAVAHAHPVIALAASPWAPLVAASGHEAILLYHTETLEFLGALPFPERTPHVLRFSRDGKILLAAGGRGAHSGAVVLFEVETAERLAEFGADEIDAVLAADISADRRYVALGGSDKLLKIYEVASGELRHRIKKHTDWVTAVAFSPDGRSVASGDRNGGIHTWDPVSGSIVFTLADHKARVTDLAWRPDGTTLASAGEDGKLVLWEMEEGFPVRNSTPHRGGGDPDRRSVDPKADAPGVLSVDYSKEGAMVTAGRDGTVRLLRSDTNGEGALEDFEDMPTAAVFTHDGARLVVGDYLGNVRFYAVERNGGKAKAELLENLTTKVAGR